MKSGKVGEGENRVVALSGERMGMGWERVGKGGRGVGRGGSFAHRLQQSRNESRKGMHAEGRGEGVGRSGSGKEWEGVGKRG